MSTMSSSLRRSPSLSPSLRPSMRYLSPLLQQTYVVMDDVATEGSHSVHHYLTDFV